MATTLEHHRGRPAADADENDHGQDLEHERGARNSGPVQPITTGSASSASAPATGNDVASDKRVPWSEQFL